MKKSLTIGVVVAGVTFLLIYIALFVKLMSLGTTTFSGDIGPSFLPFGHIETSSDGFSAENKIGSILVPLLLGSLSAAIHYFTFKQKQSKASATITP